MVCNLEVTLLIGITFSSCTRSQDPFPHTCVSPVCCCTNAFTGPTVPIATFPRYKSWLSLSLLFLSVYNSSSSFCRLCFTLPIDLPQSQTSWLWILPSEPWEARRLHTRFFPPVPGSLCRQREKGCSGLKGRTPDGHRHVGHVLCGGVWLRAPRAQPQLSVITPEGVADLFCFSQTAAECATE